MLFVAINQTGNWNATEAEKRPANQRESLDFSKDSLNSPEKKPPELEPQSKPRLERKQLTEEEEEEEEESSSSYSEAVRLESLAFTIDFGDVAPAKAKKKETPKRFAERLTGRESSSHLKRAASKSTDSKKKVNKSRRVARKFVESDAVVRFRRQIALR